MNVEKDKKLSRVDYLIESEKLDASFIDSSRMVRCVLGMYSFLGLPRFYVGDNKLGIAYILMFVAMIISFRTGYQQSNEMIGGFALFMFVMIFVIIPIIEIVLAVKDHTQKNNDKRKLQLIRETFESVEIEDTNRNIESQLMEFEIKNKKKSVRVGAIFMFFLGFVGGHRFYLGDFKEAMFLLVPFLIMKSLSFLEPSLMISGITAFIMIYVFAVSMTDLFRMKNKVYEKNKKYTEDKIKMLKSLKV